MKAHESLEGKELFTIDKVFGDGSSRITYVGRNDNLINTVSKLARNSLDTGLILGCGFYELFTAAGQKLFRDRGTRITGVDQNQAVIGVNRQIQNDGKLQFNDIAVLVNNPVFGKLEARRNSQKLLQDAQVEGIHLSDQSIDIDEKNRSMVQIENPVDAQIYVGQQKPESYSFIFAGNLENNLLYQKGYTWDRALNLHKKIAELLERGGVIRIYYERYFFP